MVTNILILRFTSDFMFYNSFVFVFSAHPFARHTDLADGRLIKHMFLHAIGEFPKNSNVLIITADSDFTSTIMDLVNTKKCNVMGCIDHEVSNSLCNDGKAKWLWDRLIVGGKSNRKTFGRIMPIMLIFLLS